MTVGCWLDEVRTAADGMAGANAAADPARSVMIAAESFMVASGGEEGVSVAIASMEW